MTTLHTDSSAEPSLQPPSFRFSTEDFPAHERVPVWREVLGRQFLNLDVDVPDDVPFLGESAFHSLPGLKVASMTTSGGRGSRTRELIARGDGDEVVLTVSTTSAPSTRSPLHLTWLGREMSLADGEAALMASDEPCSVGHSGLGSLMKYGVPVKLLQPLVGNVGDSLFKRVPHTNEALRLLVGYTRFMLGSEAASTPELRHAAAAHMRDLIALALGATRETAALAEEGGLRAARLQAIKAEVTREVASPELSIDMIARRHRLSPRSIQLLFEAEGTTFSQFVLEQRLMLAHRALSTWQGRRRSITEIALDSGFSNVSYFNRAFRQRFGASPSELRARHIN